MLTRHTSRALTKLVVEIQCFCDKGKFSLKIVQVCLTTYNGEAYIASFLDSLVNQSFEDFEVLVSDDGSSDNTLKIIENYKDRLKIVLYVNPSPTPMGPALNFMKLLSLASGDYIFLADQDDVWLRDKIFLCLDKMKASELTDPDTAKCVFSDYCVVDQDLCVIQKSGLAAVTSSFSVNKLMESVEYTNFVPGCTMMVNRKLIDLAINAGFDTHILMHDWWLVLLGKHHGGLFLYIQESLVMYRQHQHNAVGVSVEASLFKKISKFLKSPTSKLSRLKKQFNMIRAAGYKKSFTLFLLIRCYRAIIYE